MLPFCVSLASMPVTTLDLLDQAFTSVVMLASMPSDAWVGVSVLPSSVMSGAFLPLGGAFVQSWVRFVQGMKTTLTLVLAEAGFCLWNWLTTLFIQVTCAGVEEPIRHTVSCAGAADEGVDPGVDEPLELQPAIARAAAAPNAAIAAGVFLSLTAGSPSGGGGGELRFRSSVRAVEEKLSRNFPIR